MQDSLLESDSAIFDGRGLQLERKRCYLLKNQTVNDRKLLSCQMLMPLKSFTN